MYIYSRNNVIWIEIRQISMKRQCQSWDSNRHFSMDVISAVQEFFFVKNHRRPSMKRRPIQGVHGRGMGVHAHFAPVWRQCRSPKVDTSPAIRRRFIDVTPMESPKVAYYTPMPRPMIFNWVPTTLFCSPGRWEARLLPTTLFWSLGRWEVINFKLLLLFLN